MNINIFYSVFLLFWALVSKAQNVTASVGGEGTVGNMNVNYTIGEAFVTTYLDSNTILTQGFHQPYYTVTAVDENSLSGVLKVFPNPTNSILQVQIDQVDLENLVISLSDITGRIVKTSNVNDHIWETDLSVFESGLYLLIVTDKKSHKFNSFKIFKCN